MQTRKETENWLKMVFFYHKFGPRPLDPYRNLIVNQVINDDNYHFKAIFIRCLSAFQLELRVDNFTFELKASVERSTINNK